MAVGMAAPRAPFSCDPERSRGRLFAEAESRTRSAFRRDCDRVIHSTAFRRLKHKTQVFVFHEGDHYRTRLTHSLEVAQIARAIARQLGLDEDLTETLALSHDLGHPPFGHAGERALDACMRAWGGFDHNAQALRVVTALERRYPDFDGLNLTWESLEGIVKHNGALTDASGRAVGPYRETGVPAAIAAYVARHDLELWTLAGLEAQVAALADDIAYDAHDLDDGVRAGLFGIDALTEVPLIAGLVAKIDGRYPGLDEARRGGELIRELISVLIADVVTETERRIAAASPRSAAEVRALPAPLAAFSEAMAVSERDIKAFLKTRMYRHERIFRIMQDAEAIVRDLFGHYRANPDDIPHGWLDDAADESETVRRIGDYIAGMTDRLALAEHARLFDSTPELR
ncbi:MAG: deoxyguanosinetriphosphate triphosphohydrolase [Xanthobacteraceae bacterium]